MSQIIDFVKVILKACKNSKVFKKTNPWVEPIFALLKEIYEICMKKRTEKKVQIKIKILFQEDLGISLEQIKSKNYLKERAEKRRTWMRMQQKGQMKEKDEQFKNARGQGRYL